MEKWLKFHLSIRKLITLSEILLISSVILLLIGEIINQNIIKATESNIHVSTNTIQNPATVLVLGSSPTSPFFQHRINAAYELFREGLAKRFILSGDNHRVGYNEPEAMRKALLSRGIPDSLIYLDYAGFRTLDSVVRSRKIFGQSKLIIVSQKYHLYRAIYLSERNGIDAIGYAAKDPSDFLLRSAKKREWLACVKAQLDLFFDKQPKFLGPSIAIE